MANVLDNNASVFKPKKDEQKKIETPVIKQASIPAVTGALRALSTGTSNITPFTKNTSASVSPTQNTKATQEYKPGALSMRVIAADRQQGKDWSNASEEQKAYNNTYYRTLDDKKHTDMVLGLEGMRGNYGDKNWQTSFDTQYKAGQEYLKKELEDAEKKYGKDSNEYKSLERFSQDYENTARWTVKGQADYALNASSKQTDDAIRTIYSGVIGRPDFYEKAAAGEKEAGKKYRSELAGASDLQKALWYYTYHESGKDGVKELEKNFLGNSVNYQRAIADFASDIDNEDKFTRFWEANKANFASAMDQTFGGIRQAFTNTEADPNDRTLSGDYTISDSVDDYLRAQLGGTVSDETLQKYGSEGFTQLSSIGADWVKDASKDASDFQKYLIGYLYRANGNDAEIAKATWEDIKSQSDTFWQMAKGSGTLATGAGTIEGALYRDYLGLAGMKAPAWMGNAEGGEELTAAQALWDAAQTTRAQYPQIAANIIGGLVNPVAGMALGAAVMSTSVYGNTYKQAIDEGYSKKQAIAYAVAQAASEFGTDMLLSGIAPYAGALTGNAGQALVRNISNPFLKAVATAGVDALGEGVQEYLQEQLDPVFRNIIFGENNAIDLASPESVYSFFLGTVSALLMSPLGGVKTVKTNHMYKELGNMLINQDATSKMVDVILNSDLKIEKKSIREQYETAKSIAQDIKSGRVKPNALILGEMFTNAAESGVDVKWLTNPDTVNYNKDTLTEENFIAGATSRLAELGADTALAGDIARWAMGQAPSQEAFNKIKSDPKAVQVLQELIDPLDMEKDNALTRAAQSTTRNVTGNKTYDTLVASNPDQTVVNPATQQLISLGVELEEAQGIGDVIAKVMSGESITEDEAELISVSNAAVRSVLSEVAGVELSENATIGAVMDALNAVATEAADTKTKQAAVAEGAEAAARARMPIPPNTRQTITAGGIEFSHDEFIRDYMAQHNATLEQAEEAWAQRAGISAALNGEEENNGTTPGKQEGRNPDLAGRSPIPAATQRTAESGRAADTGSERGTQASGQRPAGAVQENQITKYNSEQREFIQDCVSDGFSSVSLVNGPILVAGVDENGNPITFEVNARVDSNGKLTIRWDNPYASPVSIANHERIHRWLDMVFGLHNPERTAFVMNFLNEAFDGNEAALQEMYDKYSKQYGAAYSKYSPQEAAAAIYEEIFSDMYAGLDMYDAGTAAFQEQAEMYVVQEGLRERALGEETENEAGNKFSVSVTGPNGEIIGTLDYDDDVSPNRIANDIRHYRETGELRQDGPNAPYERWKRAAASGIGVGITVDRKTQSAAPSDFRYSLATWKKSDYVTDVENAARELSEVLDVSITKARAYINTLNSVAKAIADDKTRLDYEASPGVSALIGNTEYGGSIDFSTICKKRRRITGTFTAIQRALPNTALTAEEVLTIRKMMDERGYEVNCGLCYVEGSRAKMGEYAKQFLNEYAKTDPAYLPNMAEINTPEGIEQIRLEHPDVYAAYEKFMNKLAQRKPKLYQMATAYDGEVLHKFEGKQKQVEKYNRNGGLRLQSFSDFEIIHLLDNMQVIIDMARVGLFGQAYTKVPEFAWAMGKTGLKINLSLIAKGVDANGRLLLDEKEGMKRADVDALRKAYPDTVGSIVVVFNNEQLLAAMADPFIDYIIPFHRSQWNQKLYELMGLPEGAKDFTLWQNESYIEPVYSESGKPQRPPNYMPNTYWDYNKTGKENAETYLQMCAANNRLPKFSFLLNDNGDGSYSLKEDGSTDGYWKLLIDFKMYDNDGKGAPQRAVEPIFNEGPESDPRTVLGMLKAYEGGHQNFPVAEDVVEDFVREYKASHPMERYSVANNSDRYSLAPVSAVEPKSDSWNRTHTTEEALEIYPGLWNVSAEESETRNPTQIASTQGTYRNIYKILQDQGFDGKILDASSGLGIGTQIGRDEFGFDVEDIEPYPGENYSPMYTDYSKLNNKYDAIISSAVLNVLPQDQRDALVVKMGELLNDGGKMYITTRGKDVDSLAKTGKNIQLGPMEWIETVRGSYQKGFTQNELKAYLEDALGPDFTVELSNKSNGGKFNNNTSIVVTKNGAARNEAETPQERYSLTPVAENQEVFEAPYTSEADWRKAVKDRSIEYTPEMEKRWGLSGGDMTDADAAITEALDKIEEIQARPDRKWSIRDITGLSWYKEGFTNVIDLMNSGENGKKLLKFMLRNVDEKNLNLLSQYLVRHYLPDVRKRSQKEINAFKKIVKARSDQIANERGIGHNLNVSARKTYTLSDIRSMFEQLNDDPENAALAQKIFDWAEELEQRGFIPAPFKFRSISDANGKQWGTKIRYDTNYFNDPRVSDARKAKTILHELIHKYSAYAIDLVHAHDNVGNYASYSLREAYNTLPQNIIQAVYTLDDIYDQIKYDPLFLDANGKPMYGTKNVYEMLAELSNPEFREALKKKTLWQRILDAVKKLFGIDTTNAYDSVSAAFDKLMSSYDLYRVEETYENFMQRTQNGYDRFSIAPTDQNSSPFKEGSFEATVSDLIQKADDGQALQDTINALIEKRNESLKRNNAPVVPSKDKAKPVGKTQRGIQQNQLQDLIGKYGALKKGEKAAKDVTLPERTSDERYTRRFARTAEEAAGIPERMNERIDDSLLTEDLLTYSRITDKMAVKKGDGDFKALGYKKAIKEWNENRAGTGHQPTKYDIAFGERLMIEAARNGDEAVALKVLADLAAMETQAGQVVQAARLLKKLGPTGQLYYIQKAVDRLNKQNEGRIAKGSMQPITIDKELAKAVILSETDKQMKDAMDELIANIAEQLPVTLKDKWDAWRYLSMLGNPRTHIRNVFGNAVFSPIRFTKDLLASAGEKMFIKDPLERTKAADARLGSKKYDAVREFAASDFEEMKQQITGTGKMNPLNEIMDKRKIFKSKAFGWLNKLSDWNSDMLEKEDAIFLRKAYIDAMTQFIAAKGLTLEELTGSYEGGKILNDARQYAALEAQKATYRDFNQMASALNQMKRTSGVGWFIDGLMPFTKTPMNILRRGIEYSPVGLANGIYSSLVKVGKGDISAAGAIDQIAAGMTGTGIAILGYFLAKMGLARGGEDDDDKKAQLEAAEGHQKYSLEIPGYGSYTIDWMAPVALPFFVGVEVFNQLSDGGKVTGWDLANAMTMIAEPMMSLSMLDGLNSTLSAVRYGDEDQAVMSVATNILTSYLSQGAPTIFGQIARTIDPDRRSTYTDKNSATPAWLQRFVQGVQGKVPGVESQKMAYVDAWGRKDTNASLFWRALENFISPGYANRINETPVDRELTRLAESLGDTSVLPSSISKYYQLNGERLDLNAKQYEKLKTVTGQTAFSLLGNMMDDAAYIAMGDEEKAAVVKQIMSISAAIGKQAVTPDYKPDAWIQRAIDQDNLENAAVYHALEKLDTGLSSYQLISAMDWLTDEDRGKLIMSEHTNTSRNMTDYAKKKYKFVLTDEQIAREREIYNDLFWPEYANLINDQKYINAGVAERANMISKMQSDLGEAARRQLGDELRAAGYTSVLLDDSDVPEQVIDLYSLLNRG